MRHPARGPALLLLATLAACTSIDNHLLFGQQYEAAGACLAPAQAIDDVAGPDPGTCAPSCLVASASDAGPITFVTTTCPPYPSYLTPAAQDAATSAGDLCKGALAAFADGAVCGPDAGGPPEAGVEAGPDAGPDAHDSGPEAAVDAPAGG